MGQSAVILLQIALCLTVLVLETYSDISWAREVLPRTKRQAGCPPDEFTCTSGKCIEILSVCDGIRECPDGSDETKDACNQPNITHLRDQKMRGDCLVPHPPEFGFYSSPMCKADSEYEVCRPKPLTPVSNNWILSFRCNYGYYLINTEADSFNVTCNYGKWSSETPVCRKMCPPLESYNSVAVKCFNGEGDISCHRPMRPGTRAKGECKPFYTELRPFPYSEIICKDNGQWSNQLFCLPVCGMKNILGVNSPLIEGGSPTIYSELPWHVGLYVKNDSNQWEQRCGGSLISLHIVVTAAHCVVSTETRARLHPHELKVGLGKYYREWNRMGNRDRIAVKANVREILIAPGYIGRENGYKRDLALIDLAESVSVNAVIMPACVDWKREFTITPGTLVTFAGWGKTENRTFSDVLLYANLPYIDFHECDREVPQEFRRYVTTDKFCAGFSNGTSTAVGDAGGGLTVFKDNLHYLSGIISTRVGLRGGRQFTVFTNISNEELFTWLIKTKRTFDKVHEESTEFRCKSGEYIDTYSVCDGTKECADGSDEFETTCKPLNIVCPPSKFQCAYGACIDGKNRCNRKVDCADGSDEEASACTAVRSTTPRVFSLLECKDGEFKCLSGECIDVSFVCNGRVNCADGSDETLTQCEDTSNRESETEATSQRSECILPRPPQYGTYISPICTIDNETDFCGRGPGTPVPQRWLLSFSCNEGYYLNGTQADSVITFCVQGKWSSKIPVCRKMCPPLISLSVSVKCFLGDDDIDCTKPMRPGTRAKGECKPSYIQPPPHLYRDLFCRQNGQWNHQLFYCEPVCGQRNKQDENKPLLVGGSPATYGEFPWHVGLYVMNKTKRNEWELQCGGSLISPHIILTAAHCVYLDTEGRMLRPEEIKVGLGKYYVDWSRQEPYAVKADVREIIIPTRYLGQAASYTQDMAIIDLTHSVQVHARIMPVCVDWKREFIIKPGTNGTLAGWGRTETGLVSDVLLYSELPYVDYKECVREVPTVFRHYITTDKFCGGFNNGTGPAFGDSGGGLTFVHDNLHYVYGIVSTKVKDANSFTTFTNISNTDLLHWLSYVKRVFDETHPET